MKNLLIVLFAFVTVFSFAPKAEATFDFDFNICDYIPCNPTIVIPSIVPSVEPSIEPSVEPELTVDPTATPTAVPQHVSDGISQGSDGRSDGLCSKPPCNNSGVIIPKGAPATGKI